MNEEAIDFLKAREPAFADHIDRIGLIELSPKSPDPFLGLLKSITHQQLAGAAAGAIWRRVLALFADQTPNAELLLTLSDAQLRAAGLSRSKATAMREIAAKTMLGVVPDALGISRMSEEEIREQLTQIRGVGPWTVEMLLIFTLRRPDVMPATDYGIRKGIQVLYRKRALPTPKQIEKLANRWRPHRTTAALYLWRIAESAKPAQRNAATS
jgi:3-methyladenine DNA glycosylase/8-oxoguanine DNA glycosylase